MSLNTTITPNRVILSSTKEFERAKSFEDHVVITESALDREEVAIAFKPRVEWPKPFRFYKLYR